MTTTLCVNAQYMQVSTRVEENARNAPASSSRSGSSPPTIASVMEKLQSALQKSRIDCATARPTAEGWTLSTGWYGAVRCVSVDPVLCGCVVQMGGVQYAPRWL